STAMEVDEKVDQSTSSSDSSSSSSSDSSSDSDTSSDSDSNTTTEEPAKAGVKRKLEESSSSSSSSSSESDSDSSSSSDDSDEEPPKPITPATKKQRGTGKPIAETPQPQVRKTADTMKKAPHTAPAKRFNRIDEKDVVFKDERLRDNRFTSKGGAFGSYGERAHKDLAPTRGKSFTREKNKKKRGAYSGGRIDTESHSIKFD
ncbi:jun-like transcription factor, partial [Dispira parvispora]